MAFSLVLNINAPSPCVSSTLLAIRRVSNKAGSSWVLHRFICGLRWSTIYTASLVIPVSALGLHITINNGCTQQAFRLQLMVVFLLCIVYVCGARSPLVSKTPFLTIARPPITQTLSGNISKLPENQKKQKTKNYDHFFHS